MPYIGNLHVTGDTASNFRTLDDIKSYVNSFDATKASVVKTADDTLYFKNHRYVTGQRITYSAGSGGSIGGLTTNTVYYVTVWDINHIKLATTASNATSSNNINLTSLGTGSNHTLTTAFDGVNKKFKPTRDGGESISLTRGAQLRISINGVVQRPYDISTPTEGYGIENGAIVFSTAPTQADTFWGSSIASSFQTWDISDNTVDNFTGDGSETNFALSKAPPTNGSILVTIDGVTQYPNDNNNIRAYTIQNGNVLSFTSAPANGTAIQVRHIGFAGATTGGSGGVTAYNGRTGNVSLQPGDPMVGVGINSTSSFTVGTGVTMLNFVGAGNTFVYHPSTHTVDISIAGGGGGGSGEIDKQTFNVTANQTVFNLTEKYTTGYIDVYVNGVRLSSADFTETDDDTITLATAVVAGDVVDFVSHSSVVQNTILQSELTKLRVTGITTTNNLNVTGLRYGNLGGGGKIQGSTGFAKELISLKYDVTVAENYTVAPEAGDDAVILKYNVIVDDGYDLTISSGDFIPDVYELT